MGKKYPFVLLIALVIFFVDQVSKFFISSNMFLGQSIPLINNIFHLTYIHNTGAGFGILKGRTLILVLISLFVIGYILYFIKDIKNNEKTLQILVGFILGGTIGNLLDRLMYGSVIDFLDFRIWPIFNFADSFLTIGVISLIVYFWKK